jgi:hypothetical protein
VKSPVTAKRIRLAAGQWFSPGTLVSSTNKIDHHDIAELLLKVALNITLTKNSFVIPCTIGAGTVYPKS